MHSLEFECSWHPKVQPINPLSRSGCTKVDSGSRHHRSAKPSSRAVPAHHTATMLRASSLLQRPQLLAALQASPLALGTSCTSTAHMSQSPSTSLFGHLILPLMARGYAEGAGASHGDVPPPLVPLQRPQQTSPARASSSGKWTQVIDKVEHTKHT